MITISGIRPGAGARGAGENMKKYILEISPSLLIQVELFISLVPGDLLLLFI